MMTTHLDTQSHDVIMEQYARQADAIISIIQPRAKRIQAELADAYLKEGFIVSEYVAKFNLLHQAHLTALRTKDMDEAYLAMRDINALSFNLEKNIFWYKHSEEEPMLQMKVTLSRGAFNRGMLISAYVVGVMQDRPKQYPHTIKYAEIEYIHEMYALILKKS